MTLEDVANQLLLPILGDVDLGNIELSTEKEVVEAKLRKGITGNAIFSVMRTLLHFGFVSSSLALTHIML